jgi:hypothetical protein
MVGDNDKFGIFIVELNDLLDENLLNIFKKLKNITLLYFKLF